MARSVVGQAVVVREKYFWPDVQLNIWTIVMLATAGTELGIFADFIQIQNRMRLGIPWLFPFGVTVGAITIILIIMELVLIAQRRLLPSMVMLWSFILFVFFMTGLVETAVQLFGEGNVSNSCNTYVSRQGSTGVNIFTLAHSEQNGICSSWMAAFAFWIIGCIFFVWSFIMGSQVARNMYG
ncbi:hypothetical protein M501DRAFT_987912 [Patellaria atrata CBS 101060]|uniref:MARVEL domain-containing protein n=1 Tax=Patellaria atrata CBS 101060 TaxID=1346257 RepID=A0A9P4S6A1_9PEZI|nr:hypothetical protein M501DRAFT_987912 [Patellaria atrata CBS 101060]